MKNSEKIKFWIDKTGFFAECSMIFLILAAAFRFFGCWGMWTDRVNYIMLTLLPIVCCVLLTLCVLFLGKKGFFLSFIPVLLGVVFFVYKALSTFNSWVPLVLSVLLYMVAAVLYTATVFGWIPTKWLLPPVFGLPFLYRLIMRDIPALSNLENPVTFAAGMQEMSILGMLAALFCIGMGLKKAVRGRAAKPAEAKPAAAPQPAEVPAAPAPAAEPIPAPAPAPSVQTASVSTAENPVVSDEPYTPVLTLNPEPWEPEAGKDAQPDESKDA